MFKARLIPGVPDQGEKGFIFTLISFHKPDYNIYNNILNGYTPGLPVRFSELSAESDV